MKRVKFSESKWLVLHEGIWVEIEEKYYDNSKPFGVNRLVWQTLCQSDNELPADFNDWRPTLDQIYSLPDEVRFEMLHPKDCMWYEICKNDDLNGETFGCACNKVDHLKESEPIHSVQFTNGTICQGKINSSGICEICCQPAQSSSGYCGRMIEDSELKKDWNLFGKYNLPLNKNENATYTTKETKKPSHVRSQEDMGFHIIEKSEEVKKEPMRYVPFENFLPTPLNLRTGKYFSIQEVIEAAKKFTKQFVPKDSQSDIERLKEVGNDDHEIILFLQNELDKVKDKIKELESKLDEIWEKGFEAGKCS